MTDEDIQGLQNHPLTRPLAPEGVGVEETNMPSFKDLLRQRSEDIKQKPPLPVGTYHFLIESIEFGESKKKKTPEVRWHSKCTGYDDDVQPADLEGVDWNNKSMTKTFWVTEDALPILNEACKAVLGEQNCTGRTLEENLAELKGKMYKGYVGQRPSDDGSRIFNEIQSVASFE